MALIPEHPAIEWDPITIHPNSLRLNGISLRLHTNSSSLWKYRLQMVRKTSSFNLQQELDMIHKLVQFKQYNYHIFNYWNSLISLTTTESIFTHIEALIKQVFCQPNNFSSYHLLLRIIQISESPIETAKHIFENISNIPVYIKTGSESYIEFLFSLLIVFQGPNICQDNSYDLLENTIEKILGICVPSKY